ncbi:hypothetical protein ABT144_21395 [Streptomyces sp. NPDC002039]|uniref:hypothetical protein n=1 Tax=unclassified Streptomyces TaxID=2593676 RepID=UPI00331917DE
MEAAVVDGGVGADLRHRVRVDENDVQDVAGAPRRRESCTGSRMPAGCGRQAFGDLACLVRAQGRGSTNGA